MMAGVTKIFGIHTIISTLTLLTISFFILAVARNIKEQALKSFGNIIAMLIWVAAALILVTGIYSASTGRCSMKGKKGHKGMGYKGYKHHMMKK